MLYCVKCRSVCPDTAAKCPNCGNSRLRAVDDGDMVLLHRADEYTARRLCERFDGAGVRYEVKPFGEGRVSYLYDPEVLPTDKNIYVRYEDLPAAREFSRQMKEELDRAQQADEEFEDMPPKKRILVQAASVAAFILLIMLTVFGADALANWLKGILGM